MSYFETSCKDNINVDTAFEEIANLALMKASKEQKELIKCEYLFRELKDKKYEIRIKSN